MTNGYLTYLDYLELRRRVEKRLASGNWLLLHTFIFTIGATVLGIYGFQTYYNPFDYFYVDPTMGHIVGLWSGILLLHGLWSYWYSGVRSTQRNEAIEREMRKHIEADDMYLGEDPKNLFRLHGLLNKDLRKRANIIPTLVFFIFLNAVIWIPWAINDAHSPYAWTNAPILILPLLLALAWNMWRKEQHEAHLQDQMEQLFGGQLVQENEDDYDPEREKRLSESEELVTIDEYMMKRKRS